MEAQQKKQKTKRCTNKLRNKQFANNNSTRSDFFVVVVFLFGSKFLLCLFVRLYRRLYALGLFFRLSFSCFFCQCFLFCFFFPFFTFIFIKHADKGWPLLLIAALRNNLPLTQLLLENGVSFLPLLFSSLFSVFLLFSLPRVLPPPTLDEKKSAEKRRK